MISGFDNLRMGLFALVESELQAPARQAGKP
jgi:hypothetical protein